MAAGFALIAALSIAAFTAYQSIGNASQTHQFTEVFRVLSPPFTVVSADGTLIRQLGAKESDQVSPVAASSELTLYRLCSANQPSTASFLAFLYVREVFGLASKRSQSQGGMHYAPLSIR